MSKFLKLVEEVEQEIAAADVGTAPPSPEPAPSAPQPYSGDTPASIATLGNLLKKALTMSLSDDDQYKISQLPEINEKNASAEIPRIIAIMKTYSSDVEI